MIMTTSLDTCSFRDVAIIVDISIHYAIIISYINTKFSGVVRLKDWISLLSFISLTTHLGLTIVRNLNSLTLRKYY